MTTVNNDPHISGDWGETSKYFTDGTALPGEVVLDHMLDIHLQRDVDPIRDAIHLPTAAGEISLFRAGDAYDAIGQHFTLFTYTDPDTQVATLRSILTHELDSMTGEIDQQRVRAMMHDDERAKAAAEWSKPRLYRQRRIRLGRSAVSRIEDE